MEHAAGAGMGFFSLIIGLVIFFMAVLAFLLPLFVYQIKNDIAKMRKTMDDLALELGHLQTKRKKEKEELKRQINASRTRAAKQRSGVADKKWAEAKAAETQKYETATSRTKKMD